MVAEVVERLPSRILIGQAAPLNQHAPDAAALLCLQCPLRILQDPTIQDRWKRGRGCRRIAAVLLQQPHVEHVVDPCSLGQLKAVGHTPNVLQNLKRTSITGPSLRLERGSRDCAVLCSRRSQTQSPTANSTSR